MLKKKSNSPELQTCPINYGKMNEALSTYRKFLCEKGTDEVFSKIQV